MRMCIVRKMPAHLQGKPEVHAEAPRARRYVGASGTQVAWSSTQVFHFLFGTNHACDRAPRALHRARRSPWVDATTRNYGRGSRVHGATRTPTQAYGTGPRNRNYPTLRLSTPAFPFCPLISPKVFLIGPFRPEKYPYTQKSIHQAE